MGIQLSTRELQEIELDILNYIAGICKENNIPYYLAYGTLIGAVRHQGFIPWDDDVDICMFRKDYYRFREILSQQSHPKYKLLDVTIDKDYYLPMPKVIDTTTDVKWDVVRVPYKSGIWVDIFPLDNVPELSFKTSIYLTFLDVLQRFYQTALYKSSWKDIIKHPHTILLLPSKIFGPKFFTRLLDRLSQKYNEKDSVSVATLVFTSFRRKQVTIPRIFLGVGKEFAFENYRFNCPQETDLYLRHFYGDYMKLPPKEKRVSNHTIRVYKLDGKHD